MAKAPPSRAERYTQLRAEAAKALGVKANDSRCEHYAVLTLAREVLTAKLIAGDDFDASALLRIDESLRAFTPPVKANRRVVITFADGLPKCPKCGYRQAAPEPDPPPRSRAAAPAASASAEAEPPTSSPNAVPLKRPVDYTAPARDLTACANFPAKAVACDRRRG